MQTTEIRETWTALYARLSLDDGNVGESMSIQSQKAILTRKADELGIYNYQFYVDDGYSGTNFNRPSFQQMIDFVINDLFKKQILVDDRKNHKFLLVWDGGCAGGILRKVCP